MGYDDEIVTLCFGTGTLLATVQHTKHEKDALARNNCLCNQDQQGRQTLPGATDHALEPGHATVNVNGETILPFALEPSMPAIPGCFSISCQ